MENERWPQPVRLPDTGGGSADKQKKISYSTAAKQLSGMGAGIAKSIGGPGTWNRIVDFELANISLSEIPQNIRAALHERSGKITGGREGGHLLRLVQREGPERDFAFAFIELASGIFKENRELREETNYILNGELTDTMMWWTYAPYLYRSMVERGLESKDAIKKTLEWASQSPAGKGGADRQTQERHNLPGLELFNDKKIRRYVLSDKDDISHKFTTQEAERIVTEVFGIEQKAK